MTAARRLALCVLVGAALTVSACGSDGGTTVFGGTSDPSAAASGADPAAASDPAASDPAASDPAASDPASAPASDDAGTTSGSTTPSAASGIGACTDPGASWCDTFSDEDSGWESHEPTSTSDFTSGYDTATETYHLANPQPGLNYATAPVRTTGFTPTGSVQLDVDLGTRNAASGGAGFVCWSATARNGTGYSGFVLTLTSSVAIISVRSATDGVDHVIAKRTGVSGLTSGTSQHLSAQCVQRADGSAFLAMRLDGTPLVSTTYANSTSTYSWSVSPEVALQVHGPADVYFDDFAVSRIQGS
ncbi:hypothetical protein [Jatrophihabitans fulvus]